MELSEFLQKLVEAGQKIQDTVIEYAPEAWDMTQMVVRLDAAEEIILGAIPLAVALTFLIKVNQHSKNDFESFYYEEERALIGGGTETRQKDRVGWQMFYGFGTGISSIAAIVAAPHTILNIWNWVAIFSPKLYLAHKALDGIL